MRELTLNELHEVGGGFLGGMVQSMAVQNALVSMATYTISAGIDPTQDVTVTGLVASAVGGAVAGAAGGKVASKLGLEGQAAQAVSRASGAVAGGSANGFVRYISYQVNNYNNNLHAALEAAGA